MGDCLIGWYIGWLQEKCRALTFKIQVNSFNPLSKYRGYEKK